MKNNRKIVFILLGISVVAVLLRIGFYFAYTARGGNGYEPDTGTYLSAAKAFLQDGNFGKSIRTPGYPFILAVLMKISSVEGYYPLLVAFQGLLNIAAIVHLFLLCKKLFDNDKLAIIAAAIAAVNLLDIYYTMLILSDSTAQSFIVIGAYYYVCFVLEFSENNLRWGNMLAGTAAFLIALLIRPSFMYLPAAFVIGFIAAGIYHHVDWKKLLVRIVCICFISITPILMWTSYNREHIGFDGYTPISNLNLYQYNSSVIYAKQNNISYHDATVLFFEGKDPVYQEYRKQMSVYEAREKRGMELIKSDIPYYLLYCARGVGLLFVYPGIMDLDAAFSLNNEDLKAEIKSKGLSFDAVMSALKERTFPLLMLTVDFILLIIQLGFAIAGMIQALRKSIRTKEKLMAILLIAGIILYCIAVYCQPVGAGAYSRFRTSISMLLSIFAIYGIINTISSIRNRRQAKTA